MIKEGIEKVESMARIENFLYKDASAVGQNNERPYTSKPIHPVLNPVPTTLLVHTLTGLVDYVRQNKDELVTDQLMIHIVGHNYVNLISKLTGAFLQRPVHLLAEAITPPLHLNQFQELEVFIIQLQSCFKPTETVGEILKIVGNVTDENVATVTDDGVSQAVTVKTGIAQCETIIAPRSVTLAPYRTFLEIEQPESLFILRQRSGIQKDALPTAALFEADGGKWKLEAIQRIKAWLEAELPDIAILA